MLRLRGKDSNMEQTSDIKPQIFSLQNDPLNYNSLFSACILTYTPIWRTFVWLFGANPNYNTGTIIISQEDFIKFLEAMGNSYEFVELYE